MAEQFFLFRKGDGNEGNFVRFAVILKATDCPFAAVRALLANEYIAGRRVRRHIVRNMHTDGEPGFMIDATVYEGPEGEQAFGAAWLTAALEPVTEEEARDHSNVMTLREALDPAALRQYRKDVGK